MDQKYGSPRRKKDTGQHHEENSENTYIQTKQNTLLRNTGSSTTKELQTQNPNLIRHEQQWKIQMDYG